MSRASSLKSLLVPESYYLRCTLKPSDIDVTTHPSAGNSFVTPLASTTTNVRNLLTFYSSRVGISSENAVSFRLPSPHGIGKLV